MTDLIFDSSHITSSDPCYYDYSLLRKVITKNLKSKNKVNRLTSFRQHNELSRNLLKKIVSELHDTILAKSITRLPELNKQILEILRMAIDENGIDCHKNPEAHDKVLASLQKLYDLTIDIIEEYKLAKKKASLKMKKDQQSSNLLLERKVKSAMRGSKIGSGVMRAMASPPVKNNRLKNLYNQEEGQEGKKEKAMITDLVNIGGSPIVEALNEETPCRKSALIDDELVSPK